MKKVLLLAFILVCITGTQAFADFSFTFDNSQYGVTGMLITTPNGDGSYSVIGGSVTGDGSANGGIVYSLISTLAGGVNNRVQTDPLNGGVPLFKDIIGTNIDFDNQLFPNLNPIISNNGLLFAYSLGTSNEQDINFYSNGASAYQAFGDPGYYTVNGIATATATPIPAAAYLLGSGLMGLVGIRKKMQQ